MKLSQLFSGENNTTNLNKAVSGQSPAQIARMNSQIRSLVPGQTLSGEIVGRNGSEVQIKLSEDMVLNARVDQNLNIEIGQNMTFQVKSNGSALTLSPLFTNTATDVNVLKALEMANLPVNEVTVSMTEQLMGAGMSVNRNFLLQVYREINQFANADTVSGDKISDVIGLHKLNMPVNAANMTQMESYRNLTHQLVGGMDSVLNELPGVAEHLLVNGDAAGATGLYQELFAMITGDESIAQTDSSSTSMNLGMQLSDGNGGIAGTTSDTLSGIMSDVNTADIVSMQGTENQVLQNSGQVVLENGQVITTADSGNTSILSGSEAQIPAEVRMSLSQDVLQLLDNLQLPEEARNSLQNQMQQFAEGQIGPKQFLESVQQLTKHLQAFPQGTQTLLDDNIVQIAKEQTTRGQADILHSLQKLFAKPEFKNILLNELKNQWMLTPEDVSEPGRVSETYRKLESQLKNLTQALENVGQQDSAAYKAVTNLSQNVDFLNQINQMYTYVQLPLKLQGQDANGELYVYANRKNLANNDGNISALLHLDMEHLGPVDVYVTMQRSKVNTKFYVRDDEMLDFLAEHMDLLTERLKKRGYDCSFSMTTRENAKEETTEGGIASILQQEKGFVLSQYAFDVRT